MNLDNRSISFGPRTADEWRMICHNSPVTSAGQANRDATIYVDVPTQLLQKEEGKTTLPFSDRVMPYGLDITIRIVKTVFHETIHDYLYGILPGDYCWFSRNGLSFRGSLYPQKNRVGSVLIYTNTMMERYVGSRNSVKSVVSFRFGESDLYGLILPLDDVSGIGGQLQMTGGITEIRQKMDASIKSYLDSKQNPSIK